jgi:hypothetical protein
MNKSLEELFKNNCSKCKYYDKEENDCCYGAWNRPIDEAIETYLTTNTCTFEGEGRFNNE